MSAICLILIGLMVPPNSYSVECVPRAISFVVAKDGDISHTVELRSRVNEPLSLTLVYGPNDVETDGSIWMSGGREYDLRVTLKVPAGTWAEVQQMREEGLEKPEMFVDKPVDPHDFIEKVKSLIG